MSKRFRLNLSLLLDRVHIHQEAESVSSVKKNASDASVCERKWE